MIKTNCGPRLGLVLKDKTKAVDQTSLYIKCLSLSVSLQIPKPNPRRSKASQLLKMKIDSEYEFEFEIAFCARNGHFTEWFAILLFICNLDSLSKTSFSFFFFFLMNKNSYPSIIRVCNFQMNQTLPRSPFFKVLG